MNDEIKEIKDEEQESDVAEDKDYNWIIAVVLILVGSVLIVTNFTGFEFDNWWALFMLIPAGFMFVTVWRDRQENGRLTNRSTGALIAGIAILAMLAIFLFDLDWGKLWPLAFILGGIAVLLGSRK